MTRRSVLLLALLALVWCVIPACSGDDATTPNMRQVGTISGRVFDMAADGPLADVTIKISSEPFVTDTTGTGTIEMIATTDADGYFLRNDIPNGFVTVEASKDGYRTPDSQSWALTPGGVGNFVFEMAPGEDPVPEFEGDDQWARPPDWGETPDE